MNADHQTDIAWAKLTGGFVGAVVGGLGTWALLVTTEPPIEDQCMVIVGQVKEAMIAQCEEVAKNARMEGLGQCEAQRYP
jgi:hypothetical protein